MKLLDIVIPLFLLTVLMSCTTSSDYNRGSLSDAMEKAKDDHIKDREVPSDKQNEWESKERQKENREDIGNQETYEGLEISQYLIALRGGLNFYSDPYFDSNMEGEVLLGGASENGIFRFYLFGGVKLLQAQKDDSIALSIKEDAFQLNGGVEVRYYPLPRFVIFSPYLIARCGGYFLLWDYKNDLISGGETIGSDIIGGLLLGTGVGIDLIHTKRFSLGAQVIPELYLFGEETSQGFSNDYFNSYGTVRFTVEAGYNF